MAALDLVSPLPSSRAARQSFRNRLALPERTPVTTSLEKLRASDEASAGFDQALLDEMVIRTYADCVAAKQRFGIGH